MMLIADPNRVYDSLEVPGYKLGQLAADADGCVYMFLEADAAVDAETTVIIHEDGGCQEVTATLAAAGTGNGKMLAVAPASPSQSIASGDFFWGCRLAPGTAGKTAIMDGAAVKYTQLYAGAEGGALTDTADLDAKVMGIVATVTAGSPDESEVVVINWPYLATDVDTTT